MWANHHNLFRYIARVDHGLVLANLLLLVVVGFIPFPTALLAATLGETTAQIGLLVYSGSFAAVAIAFNVLWYQARSHGGRLLRRDADPAAIAAISRSYRLEPPGYSLSFLLTLVNPLLGLAVLIALVVLSPAELVRRLRPNPHHAPIVSNAWLDHGRREVSVGRRLRRYVSSKTTGPSETLGGFVDRSAALSRTHFAATRTLSSVPDLSSHTVTVAPPSWVRNRT
jgi:Endosomal/lysosomal potassium channel TMEM175